MVFGEPVVTAISLSFPKDINQCNIKWISQSCKFLNIEYITRFLNCQYTGPLSRKCTQTSYGIVRME